MQRGLSGCACRGIGWADGRGEDVVSRPAYWHDKARALAVVEGQDTGDANNLNESEVTTHCERFSCVRPRGHPGHHRNLQTVLRATVPRILAVFGRLGVSEAEAAEIVQIAVEHPEDLRAAVARLLARPMGPDAQEAIR